MSETYYQTLGRIHYRDHVRRWEGMEKAKAFIRSMEDKRQAIGPTIERLVVFRMEDGLELAKELLLEVGEPVLDYTEDFIRGETERWSGPNRLRYDERDDVAYVLLRTLGDAGLDKVRTLNAMWLCLQCGNPSARDAAIWGLGDMGTEEAYALVRWHGLKDCSASVRETAKMVLEGESP